MKQQRHLRRNFSYGGYAIFSETDEHGENLKMPAHIEVKESKISLVRIAKVAGKDMYFHSECVAYDLTKKRDINRLQRKGVIAFTYETPTEMEITY